MEELTTLLNLFCLSSETGLLLGWTPFKNEQCARKQNGTHKSSLPCERWWQIYHVY